tara:strand:- start:293 stop:547 length:255 start_codon:yes stop_codon:yes gene_type:complete
MANQIVIVIPDDVEAELQSAMTDYSLNALKRVAIDAISKEINIAVSTAHAVAQQEERVLAAEQLQLSGEARIIKLEEVNQIPQE